MSLSDADLLRRHAPVIQLSRGEKYEPCSVDWYVSQSRVVDDASGKVLAETVTARDLPSFPKTAALQPRDPSGVRRGGADPTLYTRVSQGTYGSEKFRDLWYHVFFAFNGTLSSHQTDVEYVIVRVFGSDSAPSSVFMSAHSGGRWYDVAELEKRDGRIVAYAALGSHALFPGPGTRNRFLGLGSDRVVAGGKAYADLPLLSADSIAWQGHRARGDSELFPTWFAWRMSRGFIAPDYSLPLAKRAMGRWGAAGVGLALALAVLLSLSLVRRRPRWILALGLGPPLLGLVAGVLLTIVLTDDPR